METSNQLTAREYDIATIKANIKNVISSAGWVQLNCKSVGHDENTNRTIVNFKGCTEYHAKQIQKGYKSANGFDNMSDEQVSELAKNHITFSFPTDWMKDGKFVPAKGEPVRVLLTEIVNKDGITILVVDQIQPIGQAVKKSFSLDDDFSDDSTPSAQEELAKQLGLK